MIYFDKLFKFAHNHIFYDIMYDSFTYEVSLSCHGNYEILFITIYSLGKVEIFRDMEEDLYDITLHLNSSINSSFYNDLSYSDFKKVFNYIITKTTIF